MLKKLSIRTRFMLVISLFVVFMLAIGFFGISKVIAYKTTLDSTLQFSSSNMEILDKSRNIQVQFKKQVQEWKNILLRGHDVENYNKYLESFNKEEQAIQNSLKELIALMDKLHINSDMAESTLKAHAELGEQYRNALKSYDPSNPASYKLVDKLVTGIDRVPTDNIDKIVEEIQLNSSKQTELVMTDSYNNYKMILTQTIIMISAFVILGLILGIVFVSKITKPLIALRDKITDIAEADGDLTQQLVVASGDEVGQTAEKFNKMMNKIRATVAKAGKNSIELNTYSNSLTETTKDLQLTTEQISSTVEEIARGSQEIANEVTAVSSFVSNISSSANETSQEMINVMGDFEVVKESVKITQTASSEQSQQMSETIDITYQVMKAVKSLESKAETINDIVKTISGIAEQTNLLALNAAIEAARAGEHGKGFAVVADEVRKLSESSTNAAGEVFKQISEMQQAVNETISKMTQAEQSIKKQEEVVHETENIFGEISHRVLSMIEQTKGVGERMLSITKQVDSLNESVQSISAIAEQTAASTQEAAASTEEQLSSIENVYAMTKQFNQLSKEIKDTVTTFKY